MAKIRLRKRKSTKMKHSITTGSQNIMGKVPRVKDLMAHDPLILTLGMTVHDAAKKLLQNHVFAAPVVDRDGRLVGMFSQQGCMVGLSDGVYSEVPQPIFVDDYLDPHEKLRTVTENAPIMTAVAKFVGSKRLIPSLPVLRAGKVVGLIHRLDIIRTFFEITAQIPDARAAILYISGLEKKQQEIEKLR
jgi:CBS domain-containing protein